MYIALEGIDTAGKSTQLEYLKKKYPKAIFTKEPGATDIGLKLREILLNSKLKSSLAEMFLFLADRAEHSYEILQKNKEKTIISDRSLISGIAYAKDVPQEIALSLNLLAVDNTLPSHVILLKLSEKDLKFRLSLKESDNIESRGIKYLLDIQDKMQELLEFLKIKHIIINANLNKEEIKDIIWEFLNG